MERAIDVDARRSLLRAGFKYALEARCSLGSYPSKDELARCKEQVRSELYKMSLLALDVLTVHVQPALPLPEDLATTKTS